ncbi:MULTISPECIES: putative beta-lysine N-acetyltransferase [Bacillus]|uniref:putative beta-lysine N-acetyltransferase n=1 Tax=Bacillus TaxID=1386 RepID=UPI000BB92C35|nr:MULTISPECIES: putative beta-lysine N-acetyltransferase [Bacillus]
MTHKKKKIDIKNNYGVLSGVKDYFNKRLIMETFTGNTTYCLEALEALQKEEYVEKTIAKVKENQLFSFIQNGYILEAKIPTYFDGTDAYFVCKYHIQERYNSTKWIEEDSILKNAKNKQTNTIRLLPSNFKVRQVVAEDAENLSSLYKDVFEVYPVPIIDPEYIKEQLICGTIFYCLEVEGKIVAAASADIHRNFRNAEITDCATLQPYRKYGVMKVIITHIEEELIRNQIFCSFSIARSLSFGMNAVLHQLDYSYTGRLKNNCYIFDKIEDMNVWVKNLSNANFSALIAKG